MHKGRHQAYAPVGIALACLFHAPLYADDSEAPITRITIEGSRPANLGTADSASTGIVTQKQLAARAVYRPGELLEVTPGLIVSQHSGEGKANQFYLRGLNLDHGTDLRTSVDDMPVNQRSHAHGQGWTDLNFMIPELASFLSYSKGPYQAEHGDFAAAGAVGVSYVNTLAAGIASFGIGQHGYARTLLADSPAVGNGKLLYALELFRNDGPFLNPDAFRKVNTVLRYSEGTESNGIRLTLMGYRGRWNASDQIPQRAVGSGLLRNRFDTVDATDGGTAHRASLSGAWTQSGTDSASKVSAYWINNRLDLYSNFTYFLDRPDTGDQFNQADRRKTLGIDASHSWRHSVLGHRAETTIGAQLQDDDIDNGLYDTRARARLATTREDHVRQRSASVYLQQAVAWSPWLRSVIGLRTDAYLNRVDSNQALNSGTARASQSSPKLSVIAGPWERTEFYVNLGRGFHSNDARGTTIRVDPRNPQLPATREAPLVPARGMEFGARSELVRGLQSSLAWYRLDYDSELLFAGDSGSTADTGRPSRRTGVELSNYYRLASWLTMDADLAYARTRYRDASASGQYIPGSVEGVASLALTVDQLGPWFGALQLRYFGPRPLVEDNSVRSRPSITLNARIGYTMSSSLRLALEVYNLTNRRDSAIDYAYQSRLPGEASEGKFDVHFHPLEPRSLRASLIFNF
jgi:hypothetical protein